MEKRYLEIADQLATLGTERGALLEKSSRTPAEEQRLVKLEADLMQIVPKKDWIFFSQSMVLHGRYICIARKPRCFECGLVKICPFSDKNFARPADEPTCSASS